MWFEKRRSDYLEASLRRSNRLEKANTLSPHRSGSSVALKPHRADRDRRRNVIKRIHIKRTKRTHQNKCRGDLGRHVDLTQLRGVSSRDTMKFRGHGYFGNLSPDHRQLVATTMRRSAPKLAHD
ncbi:hypothetical protein EVAR_92371_1 [Eumeta japonica]|uniref:Uncharacterized protein n=1 Tax=Eumeta variegata TaxID=151549 RepID=A0A4C1TIK4_EUMVA|nr:hypothetical protein EVAR_92371_1 [Eumeta japonica]